MRKKRCEIRLFGGKKAALTTTNIMHSPLPPTPEKNGWGGWIDKKRRDFSLSSLGEIGMREKGLCQGEPEFIQDFPFSWREVFF